MKRRTARRHRRMDRHGHATLRMAVGMMMITCCIAPSGAAAQADSPRLLRSGTAFFVTHTGNMLTSAHVVRGCKAIVVWPRSEAGLPASLILIDDRLDVALLATRHAVDAIAVPAVRPVAAGAPVYTIGFGLTPSSPRVPVYTRGYAEGVAYVNGHRLLVLHAELREGNSGGPVIDASGRLAGMIVGRYTDAPGSSVAVRAEDLASLAGMVPDRGARPAQPRGGGNWRSRLERIAALVQCIDDS
ncbi:S1 family peptidase [Paraburkholderia fungorum]|uniref:S1 family peptidase n=1 Tax=Paraburkholderia fungorum TaxID=134537 RepID=UPI0038BC0087